MKVWLDIANSPHINLFSGLIAELGRSHEVIVTARPLANTIDLLKLHGIEHTVVGKHYGASSLAKACGYPVRVYQLLRFLESQSIDVALSHSSFHSPVVARALGVRSIYMNDNEHALGNIPSFLAATTILVPEFMSTRNLKRQLASPSKVLRYPGIKEGIYLHQLESHVSASRNRQGSRRRPRAYVRPEPWTAQYYKGATNFLDNLLLGMLPNVDVTLLPRDLAQRRHYDQSCFKSLRVESGALDIREIVPDCDLFIGAGGTMTREMAVLGIPTISVYQDSLLDVDRYLLKIGAIKHRPALTAAEALEFLDETSRRPANRELLDKGREAYALMTSTLLSA